ncbi:helix-turn-helix domain-containing protein [Streptomyces albireticuli]|uniref:helix-turn-helix domain-containing protein n=1 Tax=Streptomyces albireticuli TaxID=1940 RepID=UPI001E438B89|nr:helix-turn-helix transcriptional regulator [Streptomyces albireticuli]MCD9141558.1 helix-turn-helix domain-containing protein [Streptomyces albireticuli]MCD9164191.1 helix-turn-helix domain-containing protein [Streptomyces albireticuli]MCD9189732.1 helix-turn-helix domain-containing protein [Streptomyces albireticuli]
MGQQAQRTARRRKLGTALRAAREGAQISVAGAAEAVRGDSSKISRVETGRQRLTRLELDTLLDLYRVTDEKAREWLIALASEDRKRTWWGEHRDMLPGGFKENLTLESDAARIAVYQPQVVPGLLQTRAYAKAVMSGSPDPWTDEDLDFYTDFRIKRQRVFDREKPPQYLCVMQEGVIRQRIGGAAVMAAQVRRLLAMSCQPGIVIQIVPFSQSTFTCSGSAFYLYSYAGPIDLDVVQISLLDSALYLEEDEAVAKYRWAFERLRASALSAEQSVELMTSVANGLEQE